MFKKKQHQNTYNKENYKPVIRCSICTGEQVAGFKNVHTGKFEDVMLIRDDRDLDEFKKMYGVSDISREY